MWDAQIFPRYDVVAGQSWNIQCVCIDTVNDPRWAQNVSAPTIFRHLHATPRSGASISSFFPATMGQRNLFIWWVRIVQQFEERSLSKRFTESPSTSKALTYLSLSSPHSSNAVFPRASSKRIVSFSNAQTRGQTRRSMEASCGPKLWPHLLLRDLFKAVYLGKGETYRKKLLDIFSFNLNDLFVISTHNLFSKSHMSTV